VLETADVFSIFHPEAPKADRKAFSTLMSHIKEVDEAHSTVWYRWKTRQDFSAIREMAVLSQTMHSQNMFLHIWQPTYP
jgi:hypothetical protein